jgi:deoxyadenosine/deoxycytidine kinase
LGTISERDYITYRRVFDLVVENLPRPDLLIMLNAPVSVLVDRIQARGREMEQGITGEYLALLEDLYNGWMAGFDLCPVLTVPTHDLDFVHKPKHLDIVISRIHDKLAGKEEVQFPSDE